MEETLLNEEGHNEFALRILNLSYNTRQLQSLNEAFSCLQATFDCVNCVMAWVDGSLRQCGQEN